MLHLYDLNKPRINFFLLEKVKRKAIEILMNLFCFVEIVEFVESSVVSLSND